MFITALRGFLFEEMWVNMVDKKLQETEKAL